MNIDQFIDNRNLQDQVIQLTGQLENLNKRIEDANNVITNNRNIIKLYEDTILDSIFNLKLVTLDKPPLLEHCVKLKLTVKSQLLDFENSIEKAKILKQIL